MNYTGCTNYTDFSVPPCLRASVANKIPEGNKQYSMATTPKHTWYKIAETLAEINFAENGMAILTIAGKTLTVALHNNRIFACTQKCPHAGGILAEGYIDALGNIVCPMHRYKFSLQNGRNVSGEGYFLKTFCVEERTDGIFIWLE